MPTFKVRMKLEGFELEIEGERDDAALISEQIGQQFSGMLGPVNGIIEPSAHKNEVSRAPELAAPAQAKTRKKRRTSSSSTATSESQAAAPVEFRHDIQKFGAPSQEWNPTRKAIWLLYVLKETCNLNEMPAGVIASTFNQHFKSSGTIRGSNVSRDLAKAKVNEKPSPVGEDTSKNPSQWYLTDAGISMAQALIREVTSGPISDN